MKYVRHVLAALSFAVISLLGFEAHAVPILCNTFDATANASFADACFGDTEVGASMLDETAYVSGQLSTLGLLDSTLTTVDKFEDGASSPDEGLDGWTLNVFSDTSGDNSMFGYSLTVPDVNVGDVVDFVLGIKQGNDQFIAYYFEDVNLGIDGGFYNFWLNGNENVVSDYSHVSAWIEGTPSESVPEPSIIALLGAGLIGLGFARRNRG